MRAIQEFSSGKVKIVTVGDRESDIFEFLHEAKDIGASYVIRAAKDRAIYNGKNRNEPSDKLWETLEQKPSKGHLSVSVSRQKDRAERIARVTVRFGVVELRPPYRVPSARSGELGPIKVTAILVREEKPPKGAEPLEWMLLTDLPVDSFEEAGEKIRLVRETLDDRVLSQGHEVRI